MATLNLDGREFELETLSDAARAQLVNIQFTESEIARLQSLLAILQTARNTYLEALRIQLPVG